MFKKFNLTVLLVLCFSLDCSASFWEALGQCFSNPCNCGFGDQIERWHGEDLNKGPRNPICPPWNKDGGRNGNNCLANTAYPTVFIPWHLVHCAESTPESDYFSPKIGIRNQTCNAIACWTMSKTLNWDGECLIWPSPYALPLLRICARVALPDNSKTNTPADPGYTYGKHLDFEGYEEDDEIIIGVDGKPVDFFKPKLCAYRDPSILDALTGIVGLDGINIPDLMDFNPVKQPYHKTKELHIIAKILLFFVSMMEQARLGLLDMFGSLFDMIGGAIIPNLNFFKPIFDVLGAVIEKFYDVIKAIIEEFGQINRLVSDYKFGCVEIPLGPYPPPYCPKILPYVPSATTQFVCETDSNGTVAASIASKPCVVSKAQNDPVSNTVRVTFDNFVPLCKGGQDPTKTDKCVRLENIDLFNSAETMHGLTARRDAIKPCGQEGGTDPCVRTMIPFSCSVSENGCEDGFRVVYAAKIGQKSMPTGYFMDDLEVCGSSSDTHISCQEIWGINIGEFKDISLTFPAIETAGNITDLIQTFALQDTNAMTRTFNASIVRQSRFDSTLKIQRDPNQICIDEEGEIIGCEDRTAITTPRVYDCDSGISGLPTCTSDYFVPKLVIAITSNDNVHITSAVVEPLSVHNDTTSNYLINLAGYDFTSFVTDNTYVEKPFVGAKAFNAATLFGTYKNNAVPFDAATQAITDATYLYGLEYINDKYVQGGKYACAKFSESDVQRCPINEKNCVLSNLLNRDLVNCTDFFNKAKNYTGLRLCTASEVACVAKDSIAGKNGGAGIIIYQCGGPTGNYCYNNVSNLEVCKISMKPIDRYNPAPDLDPNIITPLPNTAYYPSGLSQDYDSNLYALRDKNSVELGLCTSIPQPVCSAVNVPASSDHNASWTEATIGEQSTGTCVNGATQINSAKPLKRYCISNAENRTIRFEELDDDIGCKFSSINITDHISSFPATYPYNVLSDTTSGSIVFGTVGTTNNVNNSTYYSNITVKIDDLSKLDSFKLTTGLFKDYAIITVNGQVAYSGPGIIVNIINSLGLPSLGIATTINNKDLKPFLVVGDNNIRIDLGVVASGGLYYKIDYKLK